METRFQATDYGLIASDYVAAHLVDICDPDIGVQTGPFGSQLHQRDYVSVGTPIITVEHLGENRILHKAIPCVSDDDRDRLARYHLREGDIVFSRVGSVDRRALVRREEDGWMFSGRCLRVRPNPERIDSEYLSYFFGLSSFKEYIRAIAVGATMPSLNTRILSDVTVLFPELAEQKAIAHILGTFDDKIELNRRMNETLESIARAIFKSGFVDFDPVRAKADGRQPTGMDSEIAALFPDSFEDSPIGKIPKGWGIGRVGDVFNVTMGQSPPGETYNEFGEGILFFQGIRDFGTRFPTPRVFCTAPTRFAQKGATLVSVRAPVGEINMALEDCCIGRGLSAVRHKAGFGSYTFYAMRNLQEDFAKFEAEGTVFGSMSKQKFLDVLVLIPPERLTQKFEDEVAPIDKRIEASHRESTVLSIVRDTLLPKLISGEISVKDAMEHVEGII